MKDDLIKQTNTVLLVARALIGKIEPIGETNEDMRRLDNLQVAIAVVDAYLDDIREVASFKGSAAYSIDRAGKMADDFIRSLGEI